MTDERWQADEAAGTAYDNANRPPSSISPGAGFLCSASGDELIFDQGFPDVLGSCTVCISPVLILQHDVVNGPWSLITTDMVRQREKQRADLQGQGLGELPDPQAQDRLESASSG